MNKTSTTLAIEGGAPVRTAPWPAWPVFAEDEIAAVSAVLASGKVNYWTGDTCRKFEDEYAASCGRRHAIAVANGTLALELALIALDLRPGDEVIVPSRTFIATASCVVARGGVPVVADVDADSQNITAETIRAVLSPRTRGVIVVHLGGWPVDMDPVLALAREKNLFVVEDCAQAHGATYRGKPVGAFGHAAAFSFCQDKIISTGGEGGMLLLDDEQQWKRAWAYKDHGKGYDTVHRKDHPPGFRWLHESFGSNYRLTEPQAAIGRLQLAKLTQWREARARNAQALHGALRAVPGLRLVDPPAGIGHAFYRYYAFLDPSRLAPGWDQTRVVTAIQAEGVPCLVGSCGEIYLEKSFQDAGLAPARRYAVARQLSETSLAFLVHPTATPADMQDVARAVAKVMAQAAKS